MKTKTDSAPMFRADMRRWHWRIRSIVLSMIVLALSGLALQAGPIPRRRPAPQPMKLIPIPGGRFAVQGGVANPQLGIPRPSDRFVIIAPAELDPRMVVRARADLDAEMVFNPETGRRGLAPANRPPIIVAPVPGQAPAPVPVPENAWPR